MTGWDQHSSMDDGKPYKGSLGYVVNCSELDSLYQHVVWNRYQEALVFNHRHESQLAHCCAYFHPLHGLIWALFINGITEGTHSSPYALVSQNTIVVTTHHVAIEDISWEQTHQGQGQSLRRR